MLVYHPKIRHESAWPVELERRPRGSRWYLAHVPQHGTPRLLGVWPHLTAMLVYHPKIRHEMTMDCLCPKCWTGRLWSKPWKSFVCQDSVDWLANFPKEAAKFEVISVSSKWKLYGISSVFSKSWFSSLSGGSATNGNLKLSQNHNIWQDPICLKQWCTFFFPLAWAKSRTQLFLGGTQGNIQLRSSNLPQIRFGSRISNEGFHIGSFQKTNVTQMCNFVQILPFFHR